MSGNLPIVRLELQHMQHSISIMVSDHLGKLDREAQAAVKQAVKDFDYATEVSTIVHDIIQESIKDAVRKVFEHDSAPRKAITMIANKLIEGALKKEAGKFNVTITR